jgi:hypothetical protein
VDNKLSVQAPAHKDLTVRLQVILANTGIIDVNETKSQGTGFCGPLSLIQAKHMQEIIEQKIGKKKDAPRGCRKLDLGRANCRKFFVKNLTTC